MHISVLVMMIYQKTHWCVTVCSVLCKGSDDHGRYVTIHNVLASLTSRGGNFTKQLIMNQLTIHHPQIYAKTFQL